MKKFPDTGMDAVHTRVRVAMQDFAAADETLGEEFDDAEQRLNAALAECDDPECGICAQIMCPVGDPMHFHHDGCPSCARYESEEDEQ